MNFFLKERREKIPHKWRNKEEKIRGNNFSFVEINKKIISQIIIIANWWRTILKMLLLFFLCVCDYKYMGSLEFIVYILCRTIELLFVLNLFTFIWNFIASVRMRKRKIIYFCWITRRNEKHTQKKFQETREEGEFQIRRENSYFTNHNRHKRRERKIINKKYINLHKSIKF